MALGALAASLSVETGRRGRGCAMLPMGTDRTRALYQRSLIMTHRDRAGEPAAGESVRASESLDDAPQDPRLPSYPPDGPTDRLHDLYGSISRTFGIKHAFGQFP